VLHYLFVSSLSADVACEQLVFCILIFVKHMKPSSSCIRMSLQVFVVKTSYRALQQKPLGSHVPAVDLMMLAYYFH